MITIYLISKDLVTIGRYLHIPGLGDAAGEDFRKRITAAERAAFVAARNAEDSGTASRSMSESAKELYTRGQRMSIVHEARMEMAQEGQRLLAKYLLRRTDESLDNEGNNILKLPQITDVRILLSMYPDEAERHEKMVDELSEQ